MESEITEKQNVLNPFKGIKKIVEAVLKAPQRMGALLVRAANDWVEIAKSLPDPRFFFYRMIVEFELIFCYAQSNAGKSILCNQIAAEIAQYEYVLYIDCELSTKQYQRRSTDKETGKTHDYPPKLLRAEIDKDHLGTATLSEAMLTSIEQAAQNGIKFIFVDNVTYLCTNAEKGEVAVDFMHKLNALKEKYGLTIVVIAHTPKRDRSKPITGDDLYGSSRLMQLADSAFAIGFSCQGPDIRYVKTTKYRADEYPYPATSVAVYRLETVDGLTQFTYQGTSDEREHLREKNSLTEAEDLQELLDLHAKGLSLKEISAETGIAKSTIHRKLKKALQQGLGPTDSTTTASPDDSDVPGPDAGQAGQGGTESQLPFKDEEE